MNLRGKDDHFGGWWISRKALAKTKTLSLYRLPGGVTTPGVSISVVVVLVLVRLQRQIGGHAGGNI